MEDKEVVRKIIHIDMDAFFASVEQRDFPELRGKPVAVGGNSERGVIAAASYEARKYGVYSAMPTQIALKKCPHLIFKPHRFDVYKAVSAQVMNILHEYTDLVEPLSIDEAFLDVTSNKKNLKSATLIAQEIKNLIYETTQLTASAGISTNKFLAKIASDQDKPNGLFVIKPNEILPFIEQLPIKDFFGVGKKTAVRMNQLGIYFGKDLQKWSLNGLVKHFGKAGSFFYSIAKGIDNRPVVPNRIRKSIGMENTFMHDLNTEEERNAELQTIIEGLWRRISKADKKGRTLTLKVKFNDFKQQTHGKTLLHKIDSIELLSSLAGQLIKEVDFQKPIRLMGLSISNLEDPESHKPLQLTIDFD
ncbi:DNA polymerase IV [Labilibacter sediminis]|nr:DNA polymerase IV [Labilibacter sediminis]